MVQRNDGIGFKKLGGKWVSLGSVSLAFGKFLNSLFLWFFFFFDWLYIRGIEVDIE